MSAFNAIPTRPENPLLYDHHLNRVRNKRCEQMLAPSVVHLTRNDDRIPTRMRKSKVSATDEIGEIDTVRLARIDARPLPRYSVHAQVQWNPRWRHFAVLIGRLKDVVTCKGKAQDVNCCGRPVDNFRRGLDVLTDPDRSRFDLRNVSMGLRPRSFRNPMLQLRVG
jgi:hypothetical protein